MEGICNVMCFRSQIPTALAVLTEWQLAQRTSHFAISASIVSQINPERAIAETSHLLSRRWSNCSTTGSRSPQSTQGWAARYCHIRRWFSSELMARISLHVSEMRIPVSQVPKALVFGAAGLAPRVVDTSLPILEAK